MIAVCHSSKVEKEGGFSQLTVAEITKRNEARYSGTLFNTSIDRVKPEIRLIVSLYLGELPG